MNRVALVSLTRGQPLGLLFLASWVKSALPNWEVRLVDASREDALAILTGEPWNVIGCDLARRSRTSLPGAFRE